MKQLIQTITLLLTALILSACGGGTSSGTSSKNEITIQTKKSLLSSDQSKLSIDFLVKNEYNRDITVELNNLSVDVNPCVVKNVVMTPESIVFSNDHTQQYVNALVEFDEACTPTSYNLIGLNQLGLNGKSNSINYASGEMEITPTVVAESAEEDSETTTVETYQFYNVPSSITIDTPDTNYDFKVQLINLNAQGVSGKEIRILAYDITYGELVNMSATTDSNGFATFSFKSPQSLADIDGETLSLTLVQGEEMTTISTNVQLTFETKYIPN
ncbi:MAG TPA: hypothetical protein ENK86_02660, partial [Campylobacterales bacterium]|nr:hypothetical protein [Campylobacterales bacterium]